MTTADDTRRDVDLYRVRSSVLRYLAEVAPQPIAGAKLRARLRSTDRQHFDAVISRLIRDGRVQHLSAKQSGRLLQLTTGGRPRRNATLPCDRCRVRLRRATGKLCGACLVSLTRGQGRRPSDVEKNCSTT